MKLPMTSILITAFVAWGVTSIAWAGKPQKQHFSISESDFLIVDCDGFQVLSDYNVEGFFQLKFDEDGNLVSARTHGKFTEDVWYNSEHPDIRIAAGPGEVQNEGYDFLGDPPTVAIAGIASKVTFPGYGVVFLDTGNIVFDLDTGEILFKRGPSDFYDGNGSIICSVLSS